LTGTFNGSNVSTNMQKIQRAVLTIELPGGTLKVGEVIAAPKDAESMSLDTLEGMPVLKIVTKGKTGAWCVPMDKVECFELVGAI
jgi:hypothetical protein